MSLRFVPVFRVTATAPILFKALWLSCFLSEVLKLARLLFILRIVLEVSTAPAALEFPSIPSVLIHVIATSKFGGNFQFNAADKIASWLRPPTPFTSRLSLTVVSPPKTRALGFCRNRMASPKFARNVPSSLASPEKEEPKYLTTSTCGLRYLTALLHKLALLPMRILYTL